MERLSYRVQEELLARQEKDREKAAEVKILSGEAFEKARETFNQKFGDRIAAWTLSRENKREMLLPGGEAFVAMISKAAADNFEGALDYDEKIKDGEPYREIKYLSKAEAQSIQEKAEKKAAKEGRLRGPQD